jgi:IS30 family transposase
MNREGISIGRCRVQRLMREAGISNRLRTDFPDDESMRISHEAIYQALFVQGRGALKRELVACLRNGRALRVPRARTGQRQDGFVTPEVMISARPADIEDRAVPGHWEGDLIIGLNKSAIGNLVERTSRFTMLLHLPRGKGYSVMPRVKNGPAVAGYGAEAVRDAIVSTITTLPAELRRSLTWDRGKEMAKHTDLKFAAGLAVYFCDPQSPWQRGTNENTNGLLRQYFPKGTTYLEVFHNRQRRHSALHMLIRVEFEPRQIQIVARGIQLSDFTKPGKIRVSMRPVAVHSFLDSPLD